MRTYLMSAFLFVAPALLLPGTVSAEELSEEVLPYLQIGPVIVRPGLALKETYTDNVNYSEKNAESDFITAIAPEVTLQLPFRMHEVRLGANAEFLRYADKTDLNVSPYRVFGIGDFSFGDRLTLKVGDTYRRIEESPLETASATQEVYTSNAAALSAKYAFVDVAQAQIDYTRLTLTFPDSDYQTRDEDLVSAFVYYRVLPNTSAFLEYDFKNIAYETAKKPDSHVQSGFVGATWEFSENSKGTAKAGLLAKEFSSGDYEDYTTWAASIDLRHRISDAASVQVLGERSVNEGKQSDVRYFTTTGVYVDFTYHFLDRLAGMLGGSYSEDLFSNRYAGADFLRQDKTVRASVGLKYSFNSWLDFSLGYHHLNRDSNYESLSAEVNSVTFTVAAYR